MKCYKGVLLATGLAFSGTASAASVTLSGTDVEFTFDDATLFGVGTVVGNSLFFNPTNFKAESLNGTPGTASANETLNIQVNVKAGSAYTITSFAMAEEGDYIKNGANAEVTAGGRLGVTSNTTTCGFFACNDSSIFNAGPFAATGGAVSAWSAMTMVDLADTAGWGSDTSASISFQNDLSATTLVNGEHALIEKKFGAIGLIVNPVPVPGAVWLFGSGLLGLAGIARRKKAA